jgi:hypothetical protein
MPEIAFANRLTEADWDEKLRGWRCPALAVPGAVVDALFVDGNRTDSAKYEVLPEHTIIRWTPTDQPQRVTASIRLTKELSLGSETERWKKLAIILPVAATILSACIGAGVTLWLHSGPVGQVGRIGQAGPELTKLSDHSLNNTTRDRAYSMKLGEVVRGQSDIDHWYKFTIADKGGQPVTIKIVNRFQSRAVQWALTAQDYPVSSGDCFGKDVCTKHFASLDADTYYLVISSYGGGVAAYELTILQQ